MVVALAFFFDGDDGLGFSNGDLSIDSVGTASLLEFEDFDLLDFLGFVVRDGYGVLGFDFWLAGFEQANLFIGGVGLGYACMGEVACAGHEGDTIGIVGVAPNQSNQGEYNQSACFHGGSFCWYFSIILNPIQTLNTSPNPKIDIHNCASSSPNL
jgi:hypothetical protein